MEQIFEIYIDKNNNQIFIPMIRCNIGYWKGIEPWKKYGKDEFNNIALNIIAMLEWLKETKFSESYYNEISLLSYNCFENNGIKNFKMFSSKHICIEVRYCADTDQVEIRNWPRLSDGSYGINKDFTSDYSHTYKSNKNVEGIKCSFESAMIEAKEYLKRIHKEL